jgi:O-acetyl-ADP-ribose deacetylase (regulator of RNase III)
MAKFQLYEVEGDINELLFEALEDDVSLAHCISRDCRLGAGIAKVIRDKFGGIGYLHMQAARKPVGSVIFLPDGNRFIFHLVNKAKYWQKPTLYEFRRALEDLRRECQRLKVRRLAMPRIGCGLDRHNWDQDIRPMIMDVFKDTDIEILVASGTWPGHLGRNY